VPSANLEPLPTQRDFCLQDILKTSSASNEGSVIYCSLGNVCKPTKTSYQELYTQSKLCSHILGTLPGFIEGQAVLLHMDVHWDTLVWFWAILLAKGLSVLSSPLSPIEDHRLKHLNGLSALLQKLICITTNKLVGLFYGAEDSLRLHTIESLCAV
jgi:acyl-CoA synthetase (AMP-forming)/AMP-acid ligase II